MKSIMIWMTLFFCVLSGTLALAGSFIGEWKNPDAKGGLTRVVVSENNGVLGIQAWGRCHPEDCDWGAVELKTLGDTVSDRDMKYGFAHWDHRFSDIYMTLRRDHDELAAETFDIFKDDSGRANFQKKYRLRKDGSISSSEKVLAAASLEVVGVEPATGTLQAGDKATVKIRYECPEDVHVRIWAQPQSKGGYTRGGFFAPSEELPGGTGEIERFVGAKSPVEIDAVAINMVEANRQETLAEISYPVDLKWEGLVLAPETIAPIGQPFPGVAFTSLQGEEIDVSQMKGRVVLVDFWATWCGPCRKEMPNLAAAYQKHHEAGFEIVGISLDNDDGKLRKYIEENEMPWPQFFDGKGWGNEIAQKFAVQSIPRSFLLDRDGTVRNVNLRGEDLEKAIAQLID